MWGAEALKHEFDVSIISSNQIDISCLNSFYGTGVRPDEITIRQLRIPEIFHWTRSLAAMRGALFQRALTRIAHEYDILISAYNLCDFGVPAIHLLDLACDAELMKEFATPPLGIAGIVHRVAPLRGAYRQIVRMLARPSGRDLLAGDDLLLAYSQWIATKVEQRLQTKCGVLYPPVPGMFKYVPFKDRNSEFVCLGRVSEEKRLERVIQILRRVRNRGYDLRLRLIGGFESNVYARHIHALAQKLPWVSLEGSLSQRRKEEVLSTCAYGIHGAEGEAFGIAVAEMVNAGCITFAPVEGGPAEILNHDALLYRDDDDAVDKIIAVLRDTELQQTLLAHLCQHAGKFSTENYMCGLRAAVERFIEFKCERSAFNQATNKQARPACGGTAFSYV
jgi:glycosyltransferase involved in cell wall biosynthesis